MADLLDIDCAGEGCLLRIVTLEIDAMLLIGNMICGNRWMMARVPMLAIHFAHRISK